MRPFDAVIVGLGVMGASVAMHLARRGHRVLGVERFWPGHDRGSSSGESRMFRCTHVGDPERARLAERAGALYRDLEVRAGTRLLSKTGGLFVRPRGTIEELAMAGASQATAHRIFSAHEIRARWPALVIVDDEAGYFEEDAGVLLAEPCVAALLAEAVRSGAELQFGARGTFVAAKDRGVALDVNGVRVTAGCVVVCTGPWAADVRLSPRWPRLRVERVVSHWFDARVPELAHDAFPFVVWAGAGRPLAVLPSVSRGVKAARHHTGEYVDAESLDRIARPSESADVREHAASRIPCLAGAPVSSHVSAYTMTDDGKPFVDWVAERVLVVSACSGEGFKLAPAIGERATDLASARL